MEENNNSHTLDKSLLTNIIGNSCWTAPFIGLVLYLVRSYLPGRFAEGFLYGAVCGTANLYFLRVLLTETTNPQGAKIIRVAWSAVGLIGIIVAYFYIFSTHWLNDAAMVIGFSYFIVMTVIAGIFRKS